MSDDDTFRLIIIAWFVIVIPIGLYHRLKSWATGDAIDRREEGLFIFLTLRPIAVIGMLGLVAFLIHPHWMAWSSVALPIWARWLGAGLSVLAAMLLIWTFRALGTNLTDTVVTKKVHTLVTSGPYRWVRHPLYTSVILAVLACSLAAANWFFLVAGGLVFMLLVIRTNREEQNLLARFGDDYAAYIKRTGQFMPRLTRAD